MAIAGSTHIAPCITERPMHIQLLAINWNYVSVCIVFNVLNYGQTNENVFFTIRNNLNE